MTIVGVGKPTPSQMYLMQIAGLVIAERRKAHNPTDQEIQSSRECGRRNLCQMTGRDFGYDVERWYEFLIVGNYELAHPYCYGNMRRFLNLAGFNAPFKKDVIAKLKAEQLQEPQSAGGLDA